MNEGKRRDRLPSTSVDGGVKDDVNGGDLFFFFGCIFCLVLESEKREPTKKSPSDERDAGPTVSHGSVSKKWFDGVSRFHFEFFFCGSKNKNWKFVEDSRKKLGRISFYRNSNPLRDRSTYPNPCSVTFMFNLLSF